MHTLAARLNLNQKGNHQDSYTTRSGNINWGFVTIGPAIVWSSWAMRIVSLLKSRHSSGHSTGATTQEAHLPDLT